MKKIVSVTKRCMRIGEPGSAESCAVAIAMEEAGFRSPCVADDHLSWGADATGMVYLMIPMPPAVREFMTKYDDPVSDEPVIEDWKADMFAEFSFEIDPAKAVKDE